jgi:hypothetical protein
MPKVQALRPVPAEPPPRSPERITLAAAIERHAGLVRHLTANMAAQEALHEVINAARDRVEAAGAAVEQAKVDAAQHLTASAMGTAGAAPVSVKAARTAAQDAQDDLDAALAARAALEKQRGPAENAVSLAEYTLNIAVRNVIRGDSTVVALVARFTALHRQFASLCAPLQYLDSANMLPEDLKAWRREPTMPGDSAAPWKAAVAALASDADAPLPKNDERD